MANIRHAIEWIAENDEPAEERESETQYMISVILTADLFNKEPLEIARRVINKRRALGIIGPARKAVRND